ncbi:collagen triple helix repeat-containing protein 1-like [Montipora capricornis]|uniref:collagen triple helix repeat-containing protein 1-like n=1 Tax=Montipora capricornis TaxID=246305 RepID=UPI0035F21551
MTKHCFITPLTTTKCALMLLVLVLCSAKCTPQQTSPYGSWKQCAYKNLHDSKDIGLIKECLFYKTSANTGLRVFFNGVLRIYGCNGCCKRWYFTFNGAECSTPAAIDGVVYMARGSGANLKNLLRVRQIEGVCENVQQGIVRVGFWVGNCAGYGNADAHTGWKSVSRIYVKEVPPPQP